MAEGKKSGKDVNLESASSTPKTPNNPDGPTVEDDQKALKTQLHTNDIGRAANVEVNPPEVQQNDADWLAGRDENAVVEVEGQRETAGARMARNGLSAS